MFLRTFVLIIITLHNAYSFNILGIISVPLRSHYMAFKPLFRELARRGHNVTVVNNFPDAETLHNLTFVDLQRPDTAEVAPLERYENSDSTYWHLINLIWQVYLAAKWNIQDCEKLFTASHRVSGVKYDVIFVEQFISDCGLAYAANVYDAPIIGITSHALLPWAYSRLGIPFNVADPFYFTTTGPTKSLYRKLEDSVLYLIFNTIGRWLIQWNMNKVFQRHLPRPLTIEEAARDRIKMMFAYQHYSINGGRTLAPQILEIGGIHIVDSKPVPKEHGDSGVGHLYVLDLVGLLYRRSDMVRKQTKSVVRSNQIRACVNAITSNDAPPVHPDFHESPLSVKYRPWRAAEQPILSIININPSVKAGPMFLRTFVLIILTLHNAYSLNILGIISVPLRSHYMAFKPLFRELARRGHNVTVMNNFPDAETLHNLTFVDLQCPDNVVVAPLERYENSDSTYWHLNNLFWQVYFAATLNIQDCEKLFTASHRASGVKYDVIFVEQFISDCGLAYAANVYDAPIIGITSHALLPWAYSRLGIPFNVADPFYFTTTGPTKSLYRKLEDSVLYLIFNTIGRWFIQWNMNKVFQRHLSHLLTIEEAARDRIKMMFAYQHYSLNGGRTLAPQILEIGGIHIVDSKPVPKDLEDFLSKAKHGAIYFSFGSNLKLSSMSQNKMQEFLKAFKNIPQKVLWKWENDSFPVGHDNVLAKKWFPQLDVLCHPKVLAFISHGGMLSMSEAVHCGKPMLVVPFFGDQFTNVGAVLTSGFGNTLMFDRINAENLRSSIQELTSEKMQQNARRISQLWHDRPQNVMDSAIYWTEYVARHRTAPPSLPYQDYGTFDSLLLDVSTVFILIVGFVAVLLYLIIKLLKIIVVKLICKFISKEKVKVKVKVQ